MSSSKYLHYSKTDLTLDTSKTTPAGSGFSDNVESLGRAHESRTESLVDTRSALILKTQRINISQIPHSHEKAKSLINPESIDTDSDNSIDIFKHYCVVDGLTGGRNALIVPAEMFTVIYEFADSSENETSDRMNFREVRVRMLGDDYGIVDSHLASSTIQLGGPPAPPVKPMFKRNKVGELVFTPQPDSSVADFKDLKLGYRYSITNIIHRLVGSVDKGVRSSWSAGQRVIVIASGNKDRIDGHIIKFFHLDKINPDLKKDGKVVPGTYIGTIGRTGMMDPLAENGKDAFPHLHLEVTKWNSKGEKKFNPRSKLRTAVLKDGVPPEWNGWISHKYRNEHAPHGFAEFNQPRAAGSSHGGLDIGAPQDTRVLSPVNGTIFSITGKEKYLKDLSIFKEVLAAHNKKVKEGPYIFRFKGKDGRTYSVPFSKGQTLSLGSNDFSLQTHVAGKISHFMMIERR